MSEERFVVQGLAGQRSLEGEIPVRGAKNAVLKAMAASLLFEDKLTLTNVPHIEDVQRVTELLTDLGANVSTENSICTIDAGGVTESDLEDAAARRLRASIVLTGPILGRFGRVSFP